MLLSISMNGPDAEDLGRLLRKHPDRIRRVELGFGVATTFFPESSPERQTIVLHVETDPAAMARKAAKDPGMEGHVDDRPYSASSLLSTAIGRMFGTALAGRFDEKPNLPLVPRPLELRLSPIACKGGLDEAKELLEPIGFNVSASPPALLDPEDPELGFAPHVELVMKGTLTVADALGKLRVLIPVIDGRKHHFVDETEIDKLLKQGSGWLDSHPKRELIVARFLKNMRTLAGKALESMSEGDGKAERPAVAPKLADERIAAIADALAAAGAKRIADLGCGEGRLVEALTRDARYEAIAGVDVSVRALRKAAERLGLDRMPPAQRARIELLQGSCAQKDARLDEYDAIALCETIEHVDPERLPAVERVVFGPKGNFRRSVVVVTTPNKRYNAAYGMDENEKRHDDHRFEWTDAEFSEWAAKVAERRGCAVVVGGIGPNHSEFGQPTSIAIFTRIPAAK
jgi:3' terminal RNA ribose 2'-O-methyltransferase Hen1